MLVFDWVVVGFHRVLDLILSSNRFCYSLIDEQLVVVVVVELVMNFCLDMALHTVVATPMDFAAIKNKIISFKLKISN